MATVADINKIYTESSITIKNVTMTPIVFGDSSLVENESITLENRVLNIRKDLNEEVNLYVDKDGLTTYTWKNALDSGNVTLSPYDMYNKLCKDLKAVGTEVMLFVGGKRVSKVDSAGKQNYIINNDNSITIVAPFSKYTPRNEAIIKAYVFTNASYYGNLEDFSGWDKKNKLLTLVGYSADKYVFFKTSKYPSVATYNDLAALHVANGTIYRVKDTSFTYKYVSFTNTWEVIDARDQIDGELISPDLIESSDKYVRFNVDINDLTTIEFYTLGEETQHYIFDAVPGVFDYGPYDRLNKQVPLLYDRRVFFNGPVRNIIDNVRQGFFIREDETGLEGSLMIIDTTFDLSYVNCVKIIDFHSTAYSSTEYFIQVPEARSILNYLSEYDLEKTFLPEVLKVFQRVLLDEAYDTVKRLQDTRNITRIDSKSISKLIKFMGVTLNIYNMSVAEKRKLLEELTNFYKIVGTRSSYNLYNQATSHGQIHDLRQLFTPITDGIGIDKESTDPTNKRYVTFKTDEDLGATYYKEYVYPFTDYGDISALANKGESLLNRPRSEGKVQSPNNEISKGHPPRTDVDASSRDYPGKYFIAKHDINFYAWKWSTETNRVFLTVVEKPRKGDLIWVFDTKDQTVVGYPPVNDDVPLLVSSYNEATETIYVTGDIRTSISGVTHLNNCPAPRVKQGTGQSVTYPDDMTSREVYLQNTQVYYCWRDEDEEHYYFTNSPDLVVGQLAYLRTTTDLYNHHNYIASYTPGTGSTLAQCTLDNGLTLLRDENDDGYYDGYFEAVPIKENPYIVPPVVGPNKVSEGYDYGMLTFYKGQVSTEDDLPMTGNKKGDFYIILEDNSEKVWNSDKTTGTIDDWATLLNETEDYGSITEEIDGEWITWYEWDRPEGWYPTNHVQVSADIPTNVDYDTFMKEFKNTFYDIASAVLYVHGIERVFTIGSSANRKNQESSPFSIPNPPVYVTREITFNNNRHIQPPFTN